MDGTLYQLNFQHRYTSGVDSPQPSVVFFPLFSVTLPEINITIVIRREILKRIVIMKLNII